MALANDLRKGMAIKYNGNAAIVLEVAHRTPGNLRAFVQLIKLDFSYSDQEGYHFMDPETFETITLQGELIGDAKDFLVENMQVEILYVEGRAVSVDLPSSASLKVTESPEGVKGDSASNVMKTATLETGKVIQVPLFIKEGEIVKVDTRTGEYMGRA